MRIFEGLRTMSKKIRNHYAEDTKFASCLIVAYIYEATFALFSGITTGQILLVRSYSNLKLKLIGSNQSVQSYQMKMASSGRPPQNMKSGISQLVGSYSNLQWKTTTNGR